jgi:hypothetical protein
MTFLLACQSIWEQVLGVSLALLPSASLYRDEANVNVQQGKPIPKDEAEWIGAGFRSGWMKFDDKGIAHFEANQIAGGIRAFRYSRDYEGLNLTKLPAISVPFGLFLDDPVVDDKLLRGIARFEQVSLLCLRYGAISDVAMKEVAKLKNLTGLEISSVAAGNRDEATKFDDGIKHLVALSKLEVLNLSQTKCGDDSVEHLDELKMLRVLALQQTRVTDAGLKKVGAVRPLQVLNVLYTPITQEGIKSLVALPDLLTAAQPMHPFTDVMASSFSR